MPFFKLLVVCFILLAPTVAKPQKSTECEVDNVAFQVGEQITYVVSYSWLMLWTDVGEATFTITPEKKNGKDLIHIKSVGNTYTFYDWFFKVRDLYETWIDPKTLQPIYFNRAINEGGFTKENEYSFDWSKNQVATRIRRKSGPSQYDTLKVDKCTYDVISAIYAARNFNYSNIKKGKIFPVTAIFDKEIYRIGYKFLGEERKSIKDLGRIDCLKFQVDLVVGDVFSGDQKLYVWVTNDMNHIPVFVESPIIVGSVKARVVYWKGLKNKVQLQR